MAHRWYTTHRNGLVDVKGIGVVGKVVPVKDNRGVTVRWEGYIGSTRVGTSKTLDGAAILILKRKGLKEGKVQRSSRRR